MPLYEYRCESCAADFELLIRSGDRPACPQRGTSERLEKRLSVPAAPATSGSGLPMAGSDAWGGCGKPGCGPSGCGSGM